MKKTIITTLKLIALTAAFCGLMVYLSSCSESHGPEFEESAINLEGVPIVVTTIFHDERKSLVVEYLKSQKGGEEVSEAEVRDWMKNNTLDGFATLSYDPKFIDGESDADLPACTIHAMSIRGQKDYERNEILGHEMLHCIYGIWHPPEAEFR